MKSAWMIAAGVIASCLLFFSLRGKASVCTPDQEQFVLNADTVHYVDSTRVVFKARGERITPDSVATSVDYSVSSSQSEVKDVDLWNLNGGDEKYARSSDNPNWWWKRIKNGTYDIYDENIIYPKFIKFCVDVYNWGNKAFNSYDEEYVEGTGKKWKAYVKSDNWLDSYAMIFNHKMPVWMLSDIYCNLGVSLSFMAVSIGYSIDLSNVIGNKPAQHKKFETNFSCARFWIDFHYNENDGGTYIRRFGDYNDGHLFKKHIETVDFRSVGLDAFYIFNNRRYSQGAAYSFAKYQRKSAGSILAGFTVSRHEIDVNFSTLPENILQYLTSSQLAYKFHFIDYCLMIGYGYNWVFARNFLFNITALPAIGLKHQFKDCEGGRQDIISFNVRGRMSLTYNYKDFYAGITGKMDGYWFRGHKYNFFNSIENASLTLGVRF